MHSSSFLKHHWIIERPPPSLYPRPLLFEFKTIAISSAVFGEREIMGALILIGLLFVLIGLGVLISGVVSAMKQSRALSRQISSTGTVVDVVKRVFNPGSGVYCPVVEFTTAAGQPVRFESQFGTMPASHQVGQTVRVRYQAADPQQAEVDSATSRWLVPGCTIGMGLAFLGLGGSLFVIGLLVLAGTH
jgi:hypothetical protein